MGYVAEQAYLSSIPNLAFLMSRPKTKKAPKGAMPLGAVKTRLTVFDKQTLILFKQIISFLLPKSNVCCHGKPARIIGYAENIRLYFSNIVLNIFRRFMVARRKFMYPSLN